MPIILFCTPQKKWAHRAPEEEGAERGADGRE
ncbi:hypothetical protein PR002_g20831 [Phytophthora rubi]|uniref:Uncharacterized protein n=1 Tax=Phytophthora rubi TaxID=129364 RepID=A0A6A3JDF8_9STRA|nr:hypothetical protein PR002_g20831 [Phytophthora rubi]